MRDFDADLIDEFCDTLWLEEGLAKNSLTAYRYDLTLFASWLQREAKGNLLDCDQGILNAYFSYCYHSRSFSRS